MTISKNELAAALERTEAPKILDCQQTKDSAAIYAAARAYLAQDGWQPIASAPMDGTVVNVAVHKFYKPENQLVTVVARFRDGNWREELTDDHIDNSSFVYPPLYWRPLPAPPTGKGE